MQHVGTTPPNHAGAATSAPALRVVPEAEWDDLLCQLGLQDIYLSLGHARASALLEPASQPILLHLHVPGSGDVVLSALLRPIAGTDSLNDLITPYGFGGPVGVGAIPPVAAFHEALDEWARACGVITSFLRFHPLFGNHRSAPPQVALQRLSGTVGWQLLDGSSRARDLMAGMHGKHRNVVRKARSAGVEVSAVVGPSSLDVFAALYDATMQRLRADSFYRFPPEYWRTLQAELGDRIVVFEAAVDGRVIASALCFHDGPWMHYHLGATADEARTLGASNLVLFEAACWAQRAGCEILHLGGGLGGRDDSLLAFKRRFDPDIPLRECAIGKVVHDHARYEELSGAIHATDFFPAYRSPQPTAGNDRGSHR